MPDIHTLVLFSIAAFALTLTPGPDMLLIASRSAAQGRSAGFATWAGIAMGTYFHALAAALGLSQLFIAAPIAYDVVRYLGAAYLLYLAWSTFTSHSHSIDRNFSKPTPTLNLFLQGLITNILNPKMALFVLALFPQFIALNQGSVTVQIMTLATVINVIGFVVNGIVILMASKATNLLTGNQTFNKCMRYLLGTVLIGLAARLALDNQR